jgi:hypothetical protein
LKPEADPSPIETPITGLPFNDQDFKSALARALRLVGILAVVGVPVAWIAASRSSAMLFLVGAVIAGSSIWVWQRLMSAVLDRLAQGGTPRPMGPVLAWFFAHLIFSGCLLYVSLRGSNGSVYALIAGLGLALFALLIESIRLLKAWTL